MEEINMRQSMLTNEQSQFLHDEKEVLTNVLLRLAEINTPKEALATLQKAIVQLDELFLLVAVGEFNSGKSALINAILGEKILSEGVTPTTSRVTLIKWGDQMTEQIVDEGFAIVTYPLPLLKELNIVDSPGTNAIIRHHERLTEEYVPRSDLVLFTTSADRPMTESERKFLERILAWGKKVVFVLNKIDIFEDETALQEVRSFILKHASSILGDSPDLFPVSARLAQRASSETDDSVRLQLRTASKLDELEKYINDTLDDATRLQLKFQNPLGVADNLVEEARKMIQDQADDLNDDRQTVNSLEATITAYERDLEMERAPRLAEVENILHKLELRGLDFFDRTLRLTNIHHLIRGEKVRVDFEKEVLTDVPQQIEDQVQRLIDWFVEKELREWQQMMTYLQRRQALYIDHMVGDGRSPQANYRRELIDNVGKSVKMIIDSYDRTKEASELASNVEAAVAQTALFEVGAVGLGALVATAVASSALDVTGIIAAGTLAIVGFFVIPYKRKQAKDKFREKIVALRTNLHNALTNAFVNESKNSVSLLKDNVAPYTRFVHAEQERISKTQSQLEELHKNLSALRARIETVVK
jgi:small GTP-binding protein